MTNPIRSTVSVADFPSRALALFRSGKDTLEIARHFGINEPRAARLVWFARCREKRLPADFLNRAGTLKRIAPEQQV